MQNSNMFNVFQGNSDLVKVREKQCLIYVYRYFFSLVFLIIMNNIIVGKYAKYINEPPFDALFDGDYDAISFACSQKLHVSFL